jgi:arsenate reductase
LYYNPKCATCRRAREILEGKDVPLEILRYLESPPTAAEWREVLGLYRGNPMDFLRAREPLYDSMGLADKKLGPDEVARLLAKHPTLLARPVAVRGRKVVVARPAERIREVV